MGVAEGVKRSVSFAALGVESLTPALAKKEAQHPPDGKSQPKASPKVETPVKLVRCRLTIHSALCTHVVV